MKLFRKTRSKLLRNGQITRYLAYAFGEILLVVIGILIAINVDNWNSHRQNEIAFDALMANLEETMTYNLEEASNEIRVNYSFLDFYTKILSRQFDLNRLARSQSQFIWANQLDLNESDLNALLDIQDAFPAKYASTLPLLKQLETILNKQKSMEDIVIASFLKYTDHIISFPWYAYPDSVTEANIGLPKIRPGIY